MLLAALLPAFLLFLYIWKKDPQKEPTRWLIKAFLWGTATFLGAAIPEEAVKLFALWMVLRKNPFFDEHFDGIVYAVCVGLGFAAVENVKYVFSSEEAWAFTAIARALLAVPGHYAFAVLMGYFYSLYHFVDRSPRTALCILLVPVLAHGIYDALAMSGMVNEYVGGIAFFVLIYFCVKMHKAANKKVLVLIEKDKSSASEA